MAEQTIKRLYDALDRHDGDGAAACYAHDAVFRDPAFGRLEDGAVKDLWRMLCSRSDDLHVVLLEHGPDSFSLRRCGAQALGRRGTVLGTTGLLGRAVRRQARGLLEQYRS